MKWLNKNLFLVLLLSIPAGSLLAQPIIQTPDIVRPQAMGSGFSNLRVTKTAADGTEARLNLEYTYDGQGGLSALVIPVLEKKDQKGVSSWFGVDPQTVGRGRGFLSFTVKYFNDEMGVPPELTTDRVRMLILDNGGHILLGSSLMLQTIQWGSPNAKAVLKPAIPTVIIKPETTPGGTPEIKVKSAAEKLAEAKAQAQAREEARLKAEAEAKRLVKEQKLAEEKAKVEAKERETARLKAEAEAKRLADEKKRAEAKAKAEELARAKARAKAEAEAKARNDAELKAKALAEAREAARLKAEAEAKKLAEEKRLAEEQAQAQAKAKAETKLAAEAEAKRAIEEKKLAAQKAKEEALAREAARKQAEAEEKARLQAEAKAKTEAAAREVARLKAEAEAKRLAEETRVAEEKAKLEAETQEKARLEAEAKAREEARLKAEAEAKRLAEEKRLAEARAKSEAQAREEARLKAETEEKARLTAEAKAKAEAEAFRLAEEKRLADEKLRADAEAREKARLAAEEKAREDARLKAEAEAKRLTAERRVADEKAKAEALVREQARLKAEAEEKVRQEAEVKAKAEADAREMARLKAESEAKKLAEEKRLAEEKVKADAIAREAARVKAEAEAKRLAEEEKKAAALAASAKPAVAPALTSTDTTAALAANLKTKITNVDVVNRSLDRSKMTIGVEFEYRDNFGKPMLGVDLARNGEPDSAKLFEANPTEIGKSRRNFVLFPVKFNPPSAAANAYNSFTSDRLLVYLQEAAARTRFNLLDLTMILLWQAPGTAPSAVAAPKTGSSLDLDDFKQNDASSGYVTVRYNLVSGTGRLRMRLFLAADPASADYIASQDVRITQPGRNLQLLEFAVKPDAKTTSEMIKVDTLEVELQDASGNVLAKFSKSVPANLMKPKK